MKTNLKLRKEKQEEQWKKVMNNKIKKTMGRKAYWNSEKNGQQKKADKNSKKTTNKYIEDDQ